MAHHGKKPFENMPKKFREEIQKSIGDRKPLDMNSWEPALQKEDTAFKEQALQRALLDVTGFKGAFGTHSQGKLTPDDEGDIQFRVGSENNKVVLDFGTPVAWVGMDAQQAADLASSLMKWARIVGRKNGETITFNLNAT